MGTKIVKMGAQPFESVGSGGKRVGGADASHVVEGDQSLGPDLPVSDHEVALLCHVPVNAERVQLSEDVVDRVATREERLDDGSC